MSICVTNIQHISHAMQEIQFMFVCKTGLIMYVCTFEYVIVLRRDVLFVNRQP